MTSFADMLSKNPLSEDAKVVFVQVYERALEDLAEMPDGYMVESGFLARLACDAKMMTEEERDRVIASVKEKTKVKGGVPVWYLRERIREALACLGVGDANGLTLMEGERRHSGS